MKTKILLISLITLLGVKVSLAQCYAGFTYSSAPSSQTVYFYDSSFVSSGNILSYTWSFGDNTSDSGAFVSHIYNAQGIYAVTLTISTSTGCTSSFTDTIWVANPNCNMVPIMTYSAILEELSVQVSGGTPPYAYNWTNGGNGSTISTAGTGSGTYCVTVTDAQGCISQNCYTVTTISTCQAFFSSQIVPGTNNVNFINTSSASSGNMIVSYQWNFGDGTLSTVANPIHSYAATGAYMVNLAISTSNGCTSSFFDTIYIGTQPCNFSSNIYYDAPNSQLFALPFGGTGPYTYLWSPASGLSSPVVSNPTVNVSFMTTYCVTITDANGCTYTGCAPVAPAYSDTICGTVFIDTNGNGVKDSSEVPGFGYLSIYGTGGQFSAYVDSMDGHYLLTVPSGTYDIYLCGFGLGVTFTVPGNDTAGCGIYNNVVISGGGAHCGFNFGIQYNQAFIEGNLFVDSNNNGQMDSGEIGIPYQSVHTSGYWGYTDLNGHYKITVAPGTHTVSYSPSGNYAGYSLTTPSSYTVTLANGASSLNNNFGLYIAPGSTNLAVSIVPHTTVSPGFPAWYSITVSNIGANPSGATLTMMYDPALQFTNSNPAQASVNTGTRTITWNVPVIAPGSSKYYYAHFIASTSISIGTGTFEFVDVQASNGIDVNLSNNFDSIHQTITGSWDPNNKLVVSSNFSETSYQVISSVNPDQTIHYTINFQNTGNAPAVNISVLDDLSIDLDPTSFELLETSHNAKVTRNGSKLNFLFANIMLEDSTHNEPASHGYINFKVNAKPGLPAGHVISDIAAIYFDFNAPVATNDAALLMINPLSVVSLGKDLTYSVQPNPIKDFMDIQFNLKRTSNASLKIKSIEGKLIESIDLSSMQAGLNKFRLNTTGYAEGMYLIELFDGNSRSIHKCVKTN